MQILNRLWMGLWMQTDVVFPSIIASGHIYMRCLVSIGLILLHISAANKNFANVLKHSSFSLICIKRHTKTIHMH